MCESYLLHTSFGFMNIYFLNIKIIVKSLTKNKFLVMIALASWNFLLEKKKNSASSNGIQSQTAPQ